MDHESGDCDDKETERRTKEEMCVESGLSLSLPSQSDFFTIITLDMSIIPTFSLSQYHKDFLACNCYFQPLF